MEKNFDFWTTLIFAPIFLAKSAKGTELKINEKRILRSSLKQWRHIIKFKLRPLPNLLFLLVFVQTFLLSFLMAC